LSPFLHPYRRSTPESGALWSDQPFEGVQRLREICRGSFDIALDLRIDDDTRFLLKHIEAGIRCGVGSRARHPFLDIVFPPQFARRESEDKWFRIDPDRFESQMPTRLPLFHENDFSVTNTTSFSGPTSDCRKADFGRILGCACRPHFRASRGVKIVVDVTRGVGSEILGAGQVSWTRSGDPRGAVVEFTNNDAGAVHEFRIHARGRPMFTRLRFFGVRLERSRARRIIPLSQVSQNLGLAGQIRNGAGFEFFGRS
jgi:hypothetical protein